MASRGSFGGDYHLVFTQPETYGLTTDLDFYSLKDTQTNKWHLNNEDHIWSLVCVRESRKIHIHYVNQKHS